MLYLRFTPSIHDSQRLKELREARNTLELSQATPGLYVGDLRRHALARSVHYSTRIEGNTLSLSQVETLLRGGQVAAPSAQQREALNYYEAMEYAQSIAASPSPRLTEDVLKAAHFIVTKSLPGDYNSGRYRSVQNFVINSASQRAIFRPPPPEQVPGLMEEYVRWLNSPHRDLHPYYRAGLAHLNLVAIHPFDDGNGRAARVIESLLLYLAGYRAQDLVSLEEYFGRDTQRYYRAIADALGPTYEPEGHDASPWMDYYLTAHARQASDEAARLRRVSAQVDALGEAFGSLLTNRHLQVVGLFVACASGSITNGAYRDGVGVGNQTAAKHLVQLVELGLLERHGRGRATHYTPTELTLRAYNKATPES